MMENKDVLKVLERVLSMLEVESLENGDYLVKVTYKGATPVRVNRQYIASEIAELLHRRIGHLRSGKLFGKRRPSTVD